MDRLRALFVVAVLAGVVAGLATTLVQYLGTGPLILQAETFEFASDVADHAHPETAAGHAHHHEDTVWGPRDGMERTGFTLASNVLVGIGYGLALIGLMSLSRQGIGWQRGLIWGLGGFAATMLAPSLGLPPELPGTPAADLVVRQAWWIGTVLATGSGLALLAFRRDTAARCLALALILVPHLVGAPSAPPDLASLVPNDLQHRFMLLALASGLAFWVLLGAVSGAALERTADDR